MNRHNSILGEVTMRKTGYYNKSVKGATGFTMPTKPQQSYSIMQQQIDREISNQIMFIPFPQIRNVIVTFMKPYPMLEKDDSEILVAQYKENKQLRKIDQEMTDKISRGYHQRTKLQKILNCFQKAQSLKNQVEKLKKNIKTLKDNDVPQKISDIQSQAQRLKNRSKTSQQQSHIQEEKNNEIIALLLKHQKDYSQLNQHYINLDSTYAEVRQFCQQMLKIVPIICRMESIPDLKQQIPTKNFIQYFLKAINDQFKPLAGFIHGSEAWLELYRNKVKSRSWSSETNLSQIRQEQQQLEKFISQFDSLEQGIKTKVYQKLKYISKLDQHIVSNLSGQINSNMRSYEDFVQTYTDIKEITNTKNQWAEFERIISDEERYLSDHMRLNCGLIVYYKPTKVFEEFAIAIVKRTYVLQIYSVRLTPIRNAITYINEQYSDMYKRACEDNYSRSKLRKSQVKKVLEVFEKDFSCLKSIQSQKRNNDKNIKIHSQYVTHLIESLNRLMSLASE